MLDAGVEEVVTGADPVAVPTGVVALPDGKGGMMVADVETGTGATTVGVLTGVLETVVSGMVETVVSGVLDAVVVGVADVDKLELEVKLEPDVAVPPVPPTWLWAAPPPEQAWVSM